MAADPEKHLLNFALVGDVRSGAAVVQSFLNHRSGVVCHSNLLHADPVVRRNVHEAYFGVPKPTDPPAWFRPLESSVWQYLDREVFDQPFYGEGAVGVRLTYADIRQYELAEYLQRRCREGDFCVIHVLRNPVMCFVSRCQAERSKRWQRDPADTEARPSLPIWLDAEELVSFCRDHLATLQRLRSACTDCLEVPYENLLFDFQPTARLIFDFLELPYTLVPASPGCARLRNLAGAERISNYANLRTTVPSDVGQWLAESTLL